MTSNSETWNGGDGVGRHDGAWCRLCREGCIAEKLCRCCVHEHVKHLKERVDQLRKDHK